MPTALAVTRQLQQVCGFRRTIGLLVVGLLCLTPTRTLAQVGVDSVAHWTATMQTGTLAARDAALAGLGALPLEALPAETRRVLVAELVRLNQALMTGSAVGAPGENEELIDDYYMALVGVVARFGTQDAALALAPAVTVSTGVSRRVARFGDAAVAALMPLLARRYNEDDVLETLGLVWFWADSTGSALTDSSRVQIVAALTRAAASGVDRDMLGLEGALLQIKDPAFLPLAEKIRSVAATQGARGRSTVVSMDDDVIPLLTSLATSRPPGALANGLARVILAVCGNEAAGRRNGACHSITNGVAAASKHLEKGQMKPARNGFESVGKKIDEAFADGAFTDAEHALLAGNVAMVLQRLVP